MRFLQTYYSFSTDEDPMFDKAGFLSPEFHWITMAISCLLLKQHYGHVTLYCNSTAKKVVEELCIPYDQIVTIPNIMEGYSDYELWALPKLYTYSEQHEPFLHVDCDFLLYDSLPDSFWKADLFAQNIEYDDQLYNRKCIDRFIQVGGKIPNFADIELKNKIISVANAGVLGGNDVKFIQYYTEQAYRFIYNNDRILKLNHDGFINSVYEQLFFYCLAQKYNKTISYCTEGEKLSTLFDWMNLDMSCLKKHGYCHMLGNIKKRNDAQIFASRLLEKIDPALHHHIINTYIQHGGIPISNYLNFIDTPYIHHYRTSNEILERSRSFKVSKNYDIGKIMKERIYTEIKKLDNTCIKVEKQLEDNKKEFFKKQYTCINSFWENERLYESNCQFILNPFISLTDISSETLMYITKNQKIENKMYKVVTIPDAFRQTVYEVVARGTVETIIDYLLQEHTATASDIIDNVCALSQNKYGKEEYEANLRYVERIIYRMIENCILTISNI